MTYRRMVRRVVRLLVLAICIICSLLFGHEPPSQRPGSADVGRRPPAFTETYPYADGLEVNVTDIWTGRKLGVPVVELTVNLHNHSANTFEAWMRGAHRHVCNGAPPSDI